MSLLDVKEYDVIVSIGSGNVYGAIVVFEKNAHPLILQSHQSEFPVKEKINAEELSTYMLSALHKTMQALQDKHKKRIKNVHVVFASPWFSSFSKLLQVKKDEAFTVQQKNVEKLIAEEFAEIFKGVTDGGSVVVEKALSHIKLNGYETANPYGKTAKTLDVAVYGSMVPSLLREKVESEIYTIIHPKKILFHTFPFVAWDVILPLFSPKEDFVFIDIGSEVTDVLIVRRGSIYSLVSFPMGKNHLIRKAAIHFDTHPELAASMINLYANDSAEADVKEKVAMLVNAFAEEWGIRFLNSLQDSKEGEETFIPQKAFFVSDQKISNLFSGIINKQIPNTVSLSRDNLSQFVEFGAGDIPNIFIALSAIYLHNRFVDRKNVYKQAEHLVK